jgi:hypothetical protein
VAVTANLTLFLVVVFAAAIWWGWEWPYIAKLMPVYVAALPGLLLALVQLYRDATGWEVHRASGGGAVDADEAHQGIADKRVEFRRTLAFFGWFIGGALGIWLLGIVYSLPLLVFLYGYVDGQEKLSTSLIMGLCAYALIWGLFEYLLEMRWPPGVLIGY